VQNADVETALKRLGIREPQVDINVPLPKALAVEGNAQAFQFERFWFSCGEDLHIVGQGQTASDLALRIVVPIQQKSGNLGPGKPTHLSNEIEPRLIVAPIPVVEVPSNDNERGFLVDHLADQIVKGLPRCHPNPLRSAPFIISKAFERTVEMNVAGMNETK
jgi:hypothetical protein